MNTHKAEYGEVGRIVRDPRTRKYIYAVSIPVLALLVSLGVVADGTAGLILDVAAAVLGIGTSGLAAANTPKRTEG